MATSLIYDVIIVSISIIQEKALSKSTESVVIYNIRITVAWHCWSVGWV